MAHEITIRTNGIAEMAYTGETPWHGLGNVLEAGATIEEWIAAAGMDWKIQRARARFATSLDMANGPAAELQEFDGKVVLFRSDNTAPLGIVSDDYRVVQPQAVVEFFRDLVDAAGGTLETAGTLFGGKRFWAMARFGEDAAALDQKDKFRANLLLATACDGSMTTEASWITTRVVCNNTLQMARGENAPKVKVNHRSTFVPARVKQELGIESAFTAFDRAVADMRRMGEIRVSDTGVVALTATLLHPEFATLDSDKQSKILRSKPVEAIGRLALDKTAMGSDYDGVAGTAYGWLNAVTEYVDHLAGRSNTTVDNRLNSAWFGKGAELKLAAYEKALNYAPSLDDVIAATNRIFTDSAAREDVEAVLAETIL